MTGMVPPDDDPGELSGPEHYGSGEYYARKADEALNAGDIPRAAALAAIGQVHATLAAAAAFTLHPDFTDHGTVREWKQATGQD